MSSGHLDGVATFQYQDGGFPKTAAGVLASQLTYVATMPVDNDSGNNRFTGFAVANPGAENLNMKLTLLNQDGTIADSISPEKLNPLRPQQQVALFVHEVLPSRQSFRGSLVLASQEGKGFIVVALVQNQGLYTAIPIFPARFPQVPN
jgi:hypothetical protein